MIRFTYFAAITFVFMTSCSDESKFNGVKQKSSVESGILNMHILFTDAERNVSFPIWFKDSILTKEKISKITRKIYLLDEEDAFLNGKLDNTMPRETREYWINPNGSIGKFKLTYFYDDQEIGTVSFVYDDNKDIYGYAKVSRVADSLSSLESNGDDLNYYHNVHQKLKYSDKYLAYQNMHTGDKLFYMLQKKYWGPLSVDSIMQPNPKDIVILGDPRNPEKQYRVRNKVNEMDVIKYKYNSKTNMIESITRFEYPFEIKRSFLNNKEGWCTGYIDSTFSDNIYLTRTKSEILFNKKKLPVSVSHKKENQQKKNGRITIEIFTYE